MLIRFFQNKSSLCRKYMLDTWCGVVVLVKYNIEEKQLSDVIVIQLGFRDSALLYAIGIHIALMGFQKSRL